MLNNCKYILSTHNFLRRHIFKCIQWSANRKISTNTKNHYEILNVSRNCSSKEIREAFIALSKQYHPDKNKGNPKAQEEFVKMSEAYNVLIKPESRREYDFSLTRSSSSSHTFKSGRKDDYYEVHRYGAHFRDPWKDPSFYRNRNFSEEDHRNSYYGVKGVKKIRNDQMLFWILLFAGIGIFVQISIIRYTNAVTKLARDNQSAENQRHLEYVKARAEYYGTRERQMEELMRRTGLLESEKPETDTK